jgi:hypothetical protein
MDPTTEPDETRARLADPDTHVWLAFHTGPDGPRNRVRSLVYDALVSGSRR